MVATEPRFTATGDEGGDVAAGVGTGTTWLGIGSFVWGSRQLLYSKSFKIYIYIYITCMYIYIYTTYVIYILY